MDTGKLVDRKQALTERKKYIYNVQTPRKSEKSACPSLPLTVMSNSATGFAYPISSAYPSVSSEPSQAQPNVSAGTSPSHSATTQTRQAAEEARKDRTLADFMLMLDEYEPLV